MKLIKKKLIINIEYFVFFVVFLILFTSLNFLRDDFKKTYKLVVKPNENYNSKLDKKSNLTTNIEKLYNNNFKEIFGKSSLKVLKKIIIDNYETDIIYAKIDENVMTILSKIEIDDKFVINFINSEFEKYKLSKIINNNKFYFCSKHFNNEANISELIIKLINLSSKEKLNNLIIDNSVFICSNEKLMNDIILMDFEKFSKIINDLEPHKTFEINRKIYDRNTKQFNLLISLIISFVFFMIVRLSK